MDVVLGCKQPLLLLLKKEYIREQIDVLKAEEVMEVDVVGNGTDVKDLLRKIENLEKMNNEKDLLIKKQEKQIMELQESIKDPEDKELDKVNIVHYLNVFSHN